MPAKAREGTIIIHMQSLLQRPASATEMGALRYTQMGALRIPRLPTPRATLPSRGAPSLGQATCNLSGSQCSVAQLTPSERAI